VIVKVFSPTRYIRTTLSKNLQLKLEELCIRICTLVELDSFPSSKNIEFEEKATAVL